MTAAESDDLDRFFDHIAERLRKTGIATAIAQRGCSQEEVSLVERTLRVRLPDAYVKFMRRFGKGVGSLFQGTDCTFDDLPNLREWAQELLTENSEGFSLGPADFVFSMHQGYEFLFFRADEGDNPAIYQYVEGGGPFKKSWNSFTDFLVDSIEVHEKAVGKSNVPGSH